MRIIIRPVRKPLKLRCAALLVGRAWPHGVSYEQACTEMQKKQFGSLLLCAPQMLFASKIVYTDAADKPFWNRRVVLMMDPIVCPVCNTRMCCSLRHDGTALTPAVCVSKSSPMLPACVHALGVLPVRTTSTASFAPA